MKTIFNLSLIAMLSIQLLSAQKTITGVITDETGVPLPGATVIELGTTNGVSSDFDGNYTIETGEEAALEYSFVGYSSQIIKDIDGDLLNVSLYPSNELDEVVVVAYGVQSKESIVGSIAVISDATIQAQQATTITQALQGSIPGVNIITSGGVPGTNPIIRIRGVGSINADSSPLVIVDGAPFNGNLNNIAQEQVESISVLKDASSTSLYGSRGANGVIIITTKSGTKRSKTQLTISSNYGVSTNASALHDLINVDDFTKYAWESSRNSEQYVNGLTPSAAGSIASMNLISELKYNPYGLSQPVNTSGELLVSPMWDTDWKKAVFSDNVTRKEHGVSINGGGEKTSFYFGSNYLKEEGQVKTTFFERIATRLKIDTEVNDFIKAGLNVAYTTSKLNAPSQSGDGLQGAIQWLYSVPNFYPLYQRDGNGGLILNSAGERIFDYGNNLTQLINGSRSNGANENAVGAIENYKFITNRTSTTMNGYLSVNILEQLKFRSDVFYERSSYDNFSYSDNNFGIAANVDGRVTQNRDFDTTLNLTQSLNYKTYFGLNSLNADIIFETLRYQIDELGASGIGFLTNVNVLNGSTRPEGVSGSNTEERLISLISRISYNYDKKYYLEASARRDGSTRFSEESRWGNFYSIGGSWIASEESFIRDIDFINYLKIKASYGELGNNRGIGYFPYLQLFETGFSQGENPGVLSSSPVDPILTWEKTAMLNYGFEFGIFDGLLDGSVEVYNKESIDLIYDKPLAISTGNDFIKTNVGSLRNYGVEFSLRSTIIDKEDLTLNLGLNFSLDNNEISKLSQKEFINGNKKWEVGRSLYEFYIRESAGVDPNDGYLMWYKDLLDTNGEPTGERTMTKVYSEADRYYVGASSLPDIIGGFNTSVTYKNFDLNALFNFSFGSYVYDHSYERLMNTTDITGQRHADIAKRWTKPGDVTDVPLLLNSQNYFGATSSRFLFKNDYIRLKALSIGYSFKESFTERLNVSRFRLYLQGDNIFTYQTHKGIDPEQDLSGATNNRSYQLKTFSLGVNVQF